MERKKDDETFFDAFCSEALDMGKIETKNITRIGKKEATKVRPLKISLSDAEDKSRIFKRLKRLKDADQKFQVSVTADLPPEDRNAIKIKVEEAKTKEKNQNEGGRWIFRVRGPPWDLRIVRLPAKADS